MTESKVFITEALWLIIQIVGVLITPALIVGLVVAVFQAATQVNEQTLSFLPRLMVTLLTIIAAGSWIIIKLTDLFHDIFGSVAGGA